MTHEIVVASYNENVTWVKFWEAGNAATQILPDSKISLYRAGVDLPNKGREAGQWLYHIVKNYDSLADFTFFVQADLGASFGRGGGSWPHDLNCFKAFAPPPSKGFFIWPKMIPVSEGDAGEALAPGTAAFTAVDFMSIKILWGNAPAKFSWPKIFPMDFLGAQHVLSSDIIRALPKNYYERALDLVDDPFAWWLEYGKWPAVIYDIFRQGPLRTSSV